MSWSTKQFNEKVKKALILFKNFGLKDALCYIHNETKISPLTPANTAAAHNCFDAGGLVIDLGNNYWNGPDVVDKIKKT